MLDHAPDGEQLVPRRQVLEDAFALGMDITDRLERWTEKGLAPKSRTMRCSPERGYTECEAKQILAIVRIALKLGGERQRASEIAFWLAYDGYVVPSSLVLEHIEASIEAFLLKFKRILDSRGRGKLATDEDPELLENPVFNLLLKALGLVSYDGPIRSVLEIGVGLGLRALFCRAHPTKPHDALSQMVSFFVKLEMSDNQRVQIADMLWDAFLECASLIDLDWKTNRLIRAAREVAAMDEPVETTLLAVTSVHVFIDLAGSVLPWFKDAGSLSNVTDEGTEMNRLLPPTMAAVLLVLRNDPGAQSRLADMREGRTDSIVRDFIQLRTAGEQVRVLKERSASTPESLSDTQPEPRSAR